MPGFGPHGPPHGIPPHGGFGGPPHHLPPPPGPHGHHPPGYGPGPRYHDDRTVIRCCLIN